MKFSVLFVFLIGSVVGQSPIRDPSCIYQKDFFTANGVYLKTICYVPSVETKIGSAKTCKNIGMKLANPDDGPESLSILISRAAELAPEAQGASAWIDGEMNGLCSILAWQSSSVWERKYVSCDRQFGAVCEFSICEAITNATTTVASTSTTAAPTTVMKTTVAPGINFCDSTRDFFDSNMNYQGSACLVKQSKNYFEAQQYCREIRMELFNLQKDEAKDNLYLYALELYGMGSEFKESYFYVKGYYSFGCQRISNRYGNFADTLVECNSRAHVFCEYKKTPPPPKTSICNSKKDLFDSDSNYQVTACMVQQYKNYFDAEQFCLSNGMDMLSIRGYEQRNALYAYAIEQFGYGSQTKENSLYVKGYSSYKCHRIFNGAGLFTDGYYDCNPALWFFCAYRK